MCFALEMRGTPSRRRVITANTGTTTLTQIFQDGDVTFHDVRRRSAVKSVGCFTSEPWPNNTSKQRDCSSPTAIGHITGWRDALQTVGAGAATDTARASWMNSTTSACAVYTAAAGDGYASGGASGVLIKKCCDVHLDLARCTRIFTHETYWEYHLGALELSLLGARGSSPRPQNSVRCRR